METVRFRITISPDEYRAYYTGSVKAIVTRAVDGRTIRFPANVLQKFLTHNGISGDFVLIYDDNHKFKDIKKLD